MPLLNNKEALLSNNPGLFATARTLCLSFLPKLGRKYSHTGKKTLPRWEENTPTLGRKYSCSRHAWCKRAKDTITHAGKKIFLQSPFSLILRKHPHPSYQSLAKSHIYWDLRKFILPVIPPISLPSSLIYLSHKNHYAIHRKKFSQGGLMGVKWERYGRY